MKYFNYRITKNFLTYLMSDYDVQFEDLTVKEADLLIQTIECNSTKDVNEFLIHRKEGDNNGEKKENG